METPSIRVLPCWGILKYNKFNSIRFIFLHGVAKGCILPQAWFGRLINSVKSRSTSYRLYSMFSLLFSDNAWSHTSSWQDRKRPRHAGRAGPHSLNNAWWSARDLHLCHNRLSRPGHSPEADWDGKVSNVKTQPGSFLLFLAEPYLCDEFSLSACRRLFLVLTFSPGFPWSLSRKLTKIIKKRSFEVHGCCSVKCPRTFWSWPIWCYTSTLTIINGNGFARVFAQAQSRSNTSLQRRFMITVKKPAYLFEGLFLDSF